MIVRSPKATWLYVLEADRLPSVPREKKTVFVLKHMTMAQEHAMVDQWVIDPVSSKVVRAMMGSEHLQLLLTNIVGWSGMFDENGTEIGFEQNPQGGPKPELLYRIPLNDREELARAIEQARKYDPDEVGKSSPPAESGTAAN